ncbi:hypothetical protein COK69_27545 [Bacillus cereus]|nr:hypothetical protein [Bacillus paranthracis]PFU21270.1 hypothetical protein COK69_27545 [Bacillus cereus]
MVNEIISTIFQIYRSQLKIYQRFFHYIDDSTRHIDLPTHNDKIRAPNHIEGSYFIQLQRIPLLFHPTEQHFPHEFACCDWCLITMVVDRSYFY